MSRLINDLIPRLRPIAKKAIEDMKNDEVLKRMGVTGIYISETLRSLSTQMAYFSRGRMKVSDVKRMYAAAGLYAISDAEAKTPNTQTLHSNHLSGRAFDIYPEILGEIRWTAPEEIWQRMGEIGKSYGLEWGGDWKDFKDFPHFQLKDSM